ncbi:MAG: hypothetical protein J0I24_14545 [Thiomonas arsenitoxydans]|uniref:Uncharacterized protein n=1 Tax=Thiomonas arsenitoxydans (strain DSM 22701 / CIP 110005 / 3As) TaxID=426114 RepID=A0A8I1MZT0_THIA3|nr:MULTISPECIES: helix-turn-helix transcriptional regulator [Thiomonas]MBN8745501.1 hypothetical protein [Thiomonas arsenitoxydans]ODU95903.1 MAG: hypothetical protein ABT24_10810 [Thiomonas sp. SCN 64-16]
MKKQQEIVSVLRRFAAEKRIDLQTLSARLDIPYSTLTSALRGTRPFPSDLETRKRIASVLGVTGLQVAIWCELLGLDDFIVTQNFESNALAALQAMRADPVVAHIAPSDDAWEQMPQHAKIALILMYQALTNKRLLEVSKVPAQPEEDNAE